MLFEPDVSVFIGFKEANGLLTSQRRIFFEFFLTESLSAFPQETINVLKKTESIIK